MPPRAAPCGYCRPHPGRPREAGNLRLGDVPGTSMWLACVMGVAAARDIAREDAGLLAAIVMGGGGHTRGFDPAPKEGDTMILPGPAPAVS